MNRTLVRAASIAVTLACALSTRAVANCGAEGCPLSSQGLEGSPQRYSFDLGYQYVSQDRTWDGTHEATEVEPVGHITELLTRTKTWTLSGRAQVLPSLRLTAMLPYLQREHVHEMQLHPGHFVPSAWKYEGLGDATLLAQWTALGSRASGPGEITLLGGVKLPTGKTKVEEIDGEAPEPPARPGTGSTDALAGLQILRAWRVPAPGGHETTLPVSLSALGRWNGRGTEDYRVGNDLHASLSTSYGVWHGLALLGQLNAIVHGRDEVGNTDAEAHHTGGTSLFATPGLRVDLPAGTALYGYWQMRVYERTNGPQLVAPAHLILGANVGLGH